ncbi:MAG: UbiA family prenyltransferase [Candidatus Jordarchaeales archaeon]
MPRLLRLIYNLTRPLFTLIPLSYFLVGSLSTFASPVLLSFSSFSFFQQLVKFLVSTFTLSPSFLTAYLAIFLASISGCNVNSYADAQESDKHAFYQKDYVNPIVEGSISPRNIAWISLLSSFVSILVGLIVSCIFAAIIMLGHFFSLTYSYKPRFKSKPPLDLTWNTIGLAVLPFVAGYVVYTSSPEGLSLSSVTLSLVHVLMHSLKTYFGSILSLVYILGKTFPLNYFLGSTLLGAAFYTLTATLDYEADKLSGVRTLEVALGKRRCLSLGMILYLMSGIPLLDALKSNIHFAVGFLSFLLVFMWTLMKPSGERIWLSIKALSLFLVLCFIAKVATFL